MALFSKARGILKQTLGNHINKEIASTPSIFQVIRCMSSKLFVGGLSFSTDETSLREVCSKYGDVLEVRIILDRETSRSRGFGFVTYESSEAAASAIQALDQQELHGRRLRVNYANDRTRGYGGGGGYGGNYGGGGGNYGGGGGNYGGGGGNYGGGGGYGGGNNEGYGTTGGDGGNYGSGNFGGGGAYGGGNNEGYGTAGGDGNLGTGNYGDGGGFGGGNTAGYTAPVVDNYTSSGGSYNSAGSYAGTGGGYGGSTGSGFGSGGQFPSGNDFGKVDQNFGVANGGGGSDSFTADVTGGSNTAFADNAFDQNQGFSTGGGDQFGEAGSKNIDDDQDDNDPQDYADRRA